MALYDVDPNTTNRLDPAPTASDQNPTRLSDGTTAITNKKDSSSGPNLSTRDATIRVNDGSINRIALGLLPDGSYGMKVSQPGIDVSLANDGQLIFNSSQNVFKVVATGSITLTKAANDDFESQSVAHGLSSVPALLCFIEYTDAITTYVQTPLLTLQSGTLAITRALGANVDSDNVNFYISTPNSGATYTNSYTATFKYYLLQETAN